MSVNLLTALYWKTNNEEEEEEKNLLQNNARSIISLVESRKVNKVIINEMKFSLTMDCVINK